MNDPIRERAVQWVRANGYDSSYPEGEAFYASIEALAAQGDLAAQQWLAAARKEAGHRELLAACNADRIIVPTPIGPRSASIRGSIRNRTASGLVRQREMFEVMTVGQYLAWYRQRVREHLRDEGELAAHTRVVKLIRGKPHGMPVTDVLVAAGTSWDQVMAQ